MSERYTDTDLEPSEVVEPVAQPLSDLKGKTILSIDAGEKLGQVDDILIDVANMQVAAIVTSLGSLMNKERRILSAADVTTWGRDAVLVKDRSALRVETDVADRDKWASTSNRLKGLSIVTTSGNRLGKVDDLVVDAGGRIVAYRVSEGTFGTRHRDIDAATTKSIGADAVIVEGEGI